MALYPRRWDQLFITGVERTANPEQHEVMFQNNDTPCAVPAALAEARTRMISPNFSASSCIVLE
jgi:hypothetical protein